jgi:signal transduction histidine kinase
LAKNKPRDILFSSACPGIEIFADPMLEKVFANLFGNSVMHGERVTRISVSCEPAGDGLLVTVEDNGVGIPLDLKQVIFKKGFGKNTGFGLFLAREILAITNISIHETGKHGSGARFEITVPKNGFRQRGDTGNRHA